MLAPLRGKGLTVAPLAGAWIEISSLSNILVAFIVVAPLAGAWIEILLRFGTIVSCSWSLPSRERGLKSYARTPTGQGVDVAPLAGAWIEITARFCYAK